jgi:hypothetical protein
MALRGDLFTLECARIELLTLGIGAVAAVATGLVWGVRSGAGVAAGAVLSWLSYRWLKRGVEAAGRMAEVTPEGQRTRAPRGIVWRFVGRYVLLFVGAYVILTGFKLPAIALVAGLFASAAAVIAEVIWHLARNTSHS